MKATSIEAKKEVDDRVNQFLDGVGAFSIDEENVSASNVSTQPYYTYAIKNQKKLEGYTARRDLKITLNNLDKLNDVMDFALTVKLNEIRNIELKSSKPTELEQEAMALAVKDAKDKATALANAFGAQLGDVYSINSTSNQSRYRYGANSDIERFQASSLSSKASRPGQYLQETIIFSASISAVFDLDSQ
ncbi:hypothetical protein BCU68_08835 [Vibrio sp. 10N.286.49.B3]|nr:hypothetical protein BCU68_08835 [Vibrio sp. 10N.286.49.B3]